MTEIASVLAILTYNGKYALQLRDNLPHIPAAGQWSLFGGSLQSGEDPLLAVAREVEEELCLKKLDFKHFCSRNYFDPFYQQDTKTFCFHADVSSVWADHQLREGRDSGVFEYNALHDLNVSEFAYGILKEFHASKQR